MNRRSILAAALTAWVLSLGGTGLADSRLNVRDFGARGDGATDDFPAIQRALDKAFVYLKRDRSRFGNDQDEGGAPEVFLPRGTYRISRTLLGHDVVTLVGEPGSVIEVASDGILALYLEQGFRCTVRGIHFRGGETHICFWTANRDSASITVEDCQFEGCAREAVWTEAWSKASLKTVKDVEVQQNARKDVGPYDVTRDAEGLPVLTRAVHTNSGHNSTRFAFRRCEFRNCGAAFRGSCDGKFFSHLRFRSTRPQVQPVFEGGGDNTWHDVRIEATISKGWRGAYIDAGGAAQLSLTRVHAESLTEHGAPLVTCRIRPAAEDIWGIARTYRFRACSADAAKSPTRAFIVFERALPAVLSVMDCREARGHGVDLFRFDEPIEAESDLARAICSGEKISLTFSHRWTIADNGKEMSVNVPPVLERCLEQPLPERLSSLFPELDLPFAEPPAAPHDVINVADFGLTLESSDADGQASLQRALDAATGKTNPVVRLPGRTISILSPLVLPRKVRLVGEGRTVIRAADRRTDLLHVAEGDGPLDIALDGVSLARGNIALAAKGRGRILLRNGTFSWNRGIRIASEGGPLALEGVDLTQTFGWRFVDARRADVRLVDCWIEPIFSHNESHPLMICGGTLLCEQILGVPILGDNPFRHERIKSLKPGEDCYWILNDAGTVRIRSFRFGGEFGGIPVLDQRKGGKTLVEGGFESWGNPSGSRMAFNNADPAGMLLVDGLSFLGVGKEGYAAFGGVRPRVFEVRGCRSQGDAFLTALHDDVLPCSPKNEKALADEMDMVTCKGVGQQKLLKPLWPDVNRKHMRSLRSQPHSRESSSAHQSF